ncbi:MAG: cellobiose phosphorylase [Pseudobutyrivibrio sp.]|nr:cellobiose phosphorylase [Pseudobutyrivibrio sp.]
MKYLDSDGTFQVDQPDNVANLYFPLASETGLKSCVTPLLAGDAKVDQNHFVLEPESVENLNNNKSTRNFWCRVDGKLWSATGVSAYQQAARFTKDQEKTSLRAGMLWHELTRTNESLGLQSKILSFVPYDKNYEAHVITIKNLSDQGRKLEFIPAIPLYSRSADNIRDHRHVTSLLNRMEISEYGVINTPTLSFDERGHQKGDSTYFVEGISMDGKGPDKCCGVLDDFIGAGALDWPQALVSGDDSIWQTKGQRVDGQEVIGALHFPETEIAGNSSKTYIVVIGINKSKEGVIASRESWNTIDKLYDSLNETKDHWKSLAPIRIHTGDHIFNFFFAWVGLQPELRRVYGCSFLPHHDYGRGGRGWRDLWQDCLALLIMHPEQVREMLVANFAGVREDGSNATIIGDGLGNFKADRNGIARVWMDHGFWPWMTMQLYINQTGDEQILFETQGYFESDKKGSLLEHLIKQNLYAFDKKGEHGMLRILGADWNDALDLASDRGESVAFSNAYAMNLISLGQKVLELAEKYPNQNLDVDQAKELIEKGKSLQEKIRKEQWLSDGFYNSYYDNDGNALADGNMMLTGQVFAIMGGTATDDQIKSITQKADELLYDKSCGGYRLNTDFNEVKMNMGRQFGFAFGEKENGAVFSHMAVMYANALYQRGYAKEGFKALSSLYEQAMNFEASGIYPGVPEYFGRNGKGLYHYLTGAGSWYLMTVVQEMFGVKPVMGKMEVKPHLLDEQFDKDGKVWIELPWQANMVRITIGKDGKYTMETSNKNRGR